MNRKDFSNLFTPITEASEFTRYSYNSPGGRKLLRCTKAVIKFMLGQTRRSVGRSCRYSAIREKFNDAENRGASYLGLEC